MSDRDALLNLAPPDAKDELGEYLQQRLKVSCGYTLATYQWEPSGGFAEAKGVAFLLHGVFSHASFEWLAADESNHRVLFKGSVVERLVEKGLAVIAYDHPGHGRSTGLHGFVDTHDHLRDAAIEVVEHFTGGGSDLAGKKRFIVGMSMGATTAIRVCAKRPDLADVYALVSPAVRPPDDMFGWHGRFLRFISPILGATVPQLPVLRLPPSPDENIRNAVEKDGLVHRGALRVRMGIEFLRVYSEINDIAQDLKFKSVIVFVGANDQIVSPSGIKDFVSRIQSNDKLMFSCPNLGHEVMREEPGCDATVDELVNWISHRI